MAIPITVPRLGWNMEEGVFGGWLKADGDAVRVGDALFALESEKATEEIESLDAGGLRISPDGPKPGDRLPVGAVIGQLVTSAGVSPSSPAQPVASPSVRRLARERGIDLAEVRGSGPGGRIAAEDLPTRRTSSPRARRVAAELGMDWTTITGTGRGGRVRDRDVRGQTSPPNPPLRSGEGGSGPDASRLIPAPRSGEEGSGLRDTRSVTSSPLPASGRGAGGERFLPHTPIRRTIAARMLESQRLTAPVTLTTTVDATNLVNLRGQFKSADSTTAPSYTDLLVKLSAVALQKHPLLAGRWTDDGIQPPDRIDIGIAVDTDAGLLVPVVRDVPGLGLRQLAARTQELIDRARAGKVVAADMQGGCFTVSNLGAFGIDAFTPIINYPECAVLGVGRIARRPVVAGEALVPRETVTLSLTFDHRIADGGPAARFLQTLAGLIENPVPALTT